MNFRVGDAENAAVLIDQKLREAFTPDRVFRSSRTIRAGTVFPPALRTEASGCAVMVVVIGQHWLADTGGGRRIDEPDDWVRVEIELALANDRPIIPVLTAGRSRLSVEDKLPASIAGLIERQYLRLNHRSDQRDLAQIVDEVRPHIDRTLRTPTPTNPVRLTNLRPTQRSSDLRFSAAEIDGNFYGDSIVLRPIMYAAQARPSIGFNLGRKYRTLEVTAGVLDDAAEPEQVGVFTVSGDGRPIKQVTTAHGRPHHLSVDISDVLNLKLELYRPGTTGHPMLAGVLAAGGKSNQLPELAWGDPTIYP